MGAIVNVFDALLDRADVLAWDERLRGFDAVHLASAIGRRDGRGAVTGLAPAGSGLVLRVSSTCYCCRTF